MNPKQCYVAVVIWVTTVSLSTAAVGPVTAIETDNPPGSPPYNILSITAGGITVASNRLATGITTHGGIDGTPTPEMDDFDINTALDWGLGGGNFWTVDFGGGLWNNSNGDGPDFFLFEYGGSQTPTIAAIMPDGSLGQTVVIPDQWVDLGYTRDGAAAGDPVSGSGTGQSLEGMSWAITALLDASGSPLTNNSTILGISIVDRGGVDPVSFFAMVPLPNKARDPQPADGGTDVLRDIVLSWLPGETVDTHDVYFGTEFDDVNSSSANALVGAGLDVNALDLDGLLEFGQTYYWRVNEVNAANPESPWLGDVWSFTAEPFAYPLLPIAATASSSHEANMGPEKTIDGSGLNEVDQHSNVGTDMWLSGAGIIPAWIQYEFDRAYKLHEMWVWNSNQVIESFIGLGAKEVTIETSLDGQEWTVVENVPEFAQATGGSDYTANTIVDLAGTMARYLRITINSGWGLSPQNGLSEVRILHIPLQARDPQPASGEADVAPSAMLSWRAGREAAQHEVVLSSDNEAVVNNTAVLATTSETGFDLSTAGIEFDSTYYWKINEINDAASPAIVEGDIWSFSTPLFGVVDDFESYDDLCNRIFFVWQDGFGHNGSEECAVSPYNGNGSGSIVGNASAPFAEQGTVHTGNQSMPLEYENSSEAKRQWATPQDWTLGGAQNLVLFFFGDPGNTGQLFVKVNNSKVVYDGDASAISTPFWTQWNIDLASLGANLQAVTSLSVGAESGSGIVYIDDIRLYRDAPAPAGEQIWIEGEATDTQGARWRITDDGSASGARYLGSEDGDGDDNSDPPDAEWHATYRFTVNGGTYKIWARIITSPGNSFWFRIADATSPQITREDGWINTNPMDGGDAWHWDEIHNDQQDDNVVEFTLSAGEHILEIAKREDGTFLDAIVITDKLD